MQFYTLIHQTEGFEKIKMSDPRFARLQTDPRFRRPKQKQLKTEIDERFKDVLSEDFGKVKGKGE